MPMRLLALLLVLPQLALAGGLKLVAELPDLKLSNPRMISAQRHLLVGVTWDRSVKDRAVPRYQLLDLQERKVVEVPIPLADMPRAQLDLLGTARPMVDVVHHAGDVTSFTTNAKRDRETVATYLGQYDQRTKRFSELVLLSSWESRRHAQPLGFDPTDRYFYFAVVTAGDGEIGLRGYVAMEVARVDLQTRAVDWKVKIDLPQRERPLQLVGNRAFFSPDGKKLALVEYNEVSVRERYPRDPQQQVFVVDVASKQVDAWPAPPTAYGITFASRNRYLVLGSNQRGDLVRIDLEQKKVDLQVKGHVHVQEHLLTPSGESFLVISNTVLSSPKVVEVRRVSDLKVQTAIPVRLLYPGIDGVVPEAHFGLGGRLLVLPLVDQKGWSRNLGIRLYEVPDEVDSPDVTGVSGGSVSRAMAIVLGKQYADALGLRYEQHEEDPNATFSNAALATNGDVCVTGILSGNSDGDYQVGRTKPVLARLDPAGKERWKQVAVKKGFLDYEDLGVAATPDGACVFAISSYVHPARHPNSRLVKVDAKGKVLWDWVSPGGGGAQHRIGDRFELLSDGSVQITGRWYEQPGDKGQHAWKAVIAPNGKVVADEISP